MRELQLCMFLVLSSLKRRSKGGFGLVCQIYTIMQCDKPLILCCAFNNSSNVTGTCCDSAMEENFRKCFL